jgi:nucleoside phosphorylase
VIFVVAGVADTVPMRVLVTFAVEAEFAPWRRRCKFEKAKVSASDAYRSKICDMEVWALLTGIGCRKAWMQSARMIGQGGVDICISSGFAGSLRSAHVAGDVLVAREVRAQARGITFQCDKALVELATESGAKPVGVFLTTDHVVVQAAQKRRLGVEADAVEMESAGVLSEMAPLGTRSVAIRAISDSLGEDLPIDFNRITSKSGDVDKLRLLGEIALFRTRVLSFARFFEQTRQARENLADFLSRYIERLAQVSAEPQRKVAV